MRTRVPSIVCLAALITLAAVGCQSASDTEIAAAADAVETAAAEKPAPTTGEPSAKAPTEAATKDAATATAEAPFAPPFPERMELFEPPKRAQSTVRQNEEGGETVELKGFMNVDQPRAVLSIDGVISPIAEGDTKFGVHVISIQPPSAVLQRGRSRWTATLE